MVDVDNALNRLNELLENTYDGGLEAVDTLKNAMLEHHGGHEEEVNSLKEEND